MAENITITAEQLEDVKNFIDYKQNQVINSKGSLRREYKNELIIAKMILDKLGIEL